MIRIPVGLILTVLVLVGSMGRVSIVLADDIDSMPLDSLMRVQERTLPRQVNAASKYAQSTKEAPASVTILTADDIRQFGWLTLEDVLASVRGFYISDDLNYGYLGIRGYLRPGDYNNRILLLLNGSTVNEMTNGQPPLNTLYALDLNIVERIEIVRGPGSSLYGTGAMFAVINIITKSAKSIRGVTIRGSATAPSGSGAAIHFGNSWSSNRDLVLSARVNDLNGDDVYFTEYDSPETNNGVAHKLDWEKSIGLFGHTTIGSLTAQSYLMSRLKGIPTASYGMTFNDPSSETEDTYMGVQAEYVSSLGARSDLSAKAFFNYFHYDGMYPYESPWLDTPDYMNERRFGTELRWQWTPRSFHRIVVGAEYSNHFRNEYFSGIDDSVFVDIRRPFTDYSLFVQDEYQLNNRVMFTGGLRQSWYTQGFSAIVPRAALTLIPTENATLKFLYGESFRAPALMEAYYTFPDQSKANPDLEPERISLYEINSEYIFSPALNGSVSIYSFRVRDMIDSVIDPLDELYVFRNENSAKGQGTEVELNYQPNTGTRVYASYALQQAKLGTEDQVLSNSPQHIVKCGCTIPLHKYILAAAEGQAESFRYTLLRTKTDPIGLLNLSLSSRPALLPIIASLSVRNVFDTEYGHPGNWENLTPISSIDLPIIPQRGRSITLTLGYTIGGIGK